MPENTVSVLGSTDAESLRMESLKISTGEERRG